MIDKFDYEEPCCPLTGGKDFYAPDPSAPLGRIPVDRIIRRLDEHFARNEYREAGRLLIYWQNEAIALRDTRGELAVVNELVGYYRKQNEMESGLSSIARALVLVEALGQGEMASGATIYINCATAYNAFSRPDEALPLYRRAERVYKAVLPANDSRFGALYNNMALTLEELGRYEEAESAYLSALAVMETVTGGEADAAITYVNMAHMYDKCACHDKIAPCMSKAYNLLKSEHLAHDGYYAFVLEKCAPSFGHFGDMEAYEEFKRESERIYAGH